MNLLLLTPDELRPDGTARLGGRRRLHALEVLKVSAGDLLRVGVLGGRRGLAKIEQAGDELVLSVELSEPPPARANIDVLLAMPRPKALKKVLPALASLGVDRVVLLNAAKVEKAYFSSQWVSPEQISGLFALGLEQARDTVAPELLLRERFRPFVEDELPSWSAASRWVLHPGDAPPLPRRAARERTVLAIGPEGGWVPFELELLAKAGFAQVSLGERPLRVEVVVPLVLGALGL